MASEWRGSINSPPALLSSNDDGAALIRRTSTGEGASSEGRGFAGAGGREVAAVGATRPLPGRARRGLCLSGRSGRRPNPVVAAA
jgi:hypothetical protein